MIVLSLSPEWNDSSSQATYTQPNQAFQPVTSQLSQPGQAQSGTSQTSPPEHPLQVTQEPVIIDPENLTKEQLVDLLVKYCADFTELKSRFDYLKNLTERLSKPPPLGDQSVILNINSKMSTDLFKYTKANNVDTYIPREGFKFKLVRQYKEVLWHTLNRALYANKVDVYDSAPYKVTKEDGTEEFVDKHKAIIHHSDGKQSEVLFTLEPEDNVFLVQLDIGIKHSTKAFVYKRNPVLHRQKFICKPEFLFTKVWNNGRVVWPPVPDPSKPEEETLYSRKVLIDSSDGSPRLRVFFYGANEEDDDDEADPNYVIVPNPNLASLQVSRPTDVQPPSQDTMAVVSPQKETGVKPAPTPETAFLDKSEYPPEIKLYEPYPSDTTKVIELDQDKYMVVKPEDNVFNYQFKPEVKCNFLAYNTTQVWYHDITLHKDPYASWISYRHQNRIFVFATNLFIFEKQSDENWPGRPLYIKFYAYDPIENLNDLEINPTQYELKDTPVSNEFTFKFKDNVKCSEVRHMDIVIWSYNKSRDGTNFPKHVVFVEDTTITVVLEGKEFTFNADGSTPQAQPAPVTEAAPAPGPGKPTQDGQEAQAAVLTMDQLQQSTSQAAALTKDGTAQKEASVDIQLSLDHDDGEDVDFSLLQEHDRNVGQTTPIMGLIAEGKVPSDDESNPPQTKGTTPDGVEFSDVKLPKDDEDNEPVSSPVTAQIQRAGAVAQRAQPRTISTSALTAKAASAQPGSTGSLRVDLDFVDSEDEDEDFELIKRKLVPSQPKKQVEGASEATATKKPDAGSMVTGQDTVSQSIPESNQTPDTTTDNDQDQFEHR
nr:hypothetical protein MACL_00002218 [Theileria orientalis]